MKIFISADIEGITGVTSWDETIKGRDGYGAARRRMAAETAAACRAVIAAGGEAVVRDGHGDALNVEPEELPKGTRLLRGWMRDPSGMMSGLDETFDGIFYIGYHSKASSPESPLAHTVEEEYFYRVLVNGEEASEFTFNSLHGDELGVPSLLLTGDAGMCADAEKYYPGIVTVAVKKGSGEGTMNIHPAEAIERIEAAAGKAMEKLKAQGADRLVKPLAKSYKMVIQFRRHADAKSAAWYPGAVQKDSLTVEFTGGTPLEIAVAQKFMTAGI